MKNARAEAKPVRIVFSAALAVLLWFVPLNAGPQAQMLLAITVFTGAMWLTEALPLHVTALLSTALLIVLGSVSPSSAFSHYFSPLVVLFFGGFMIARAMQRHGLDRQIAIAASAMFGTNPALFLLGLMASTAFLSLWISNTAAAAIMLPIGIFTISRMKKPDANYAKAVVLGIAFAASIGGIGTLVGTPPNAIAVADLAEKGITVTFLDWLGYGLPFTLIFLPVSWLLLLVIFPLQAGGITIKGKAMAWKAEQGMVLGVLGIAALCWLTSSIHHIPDAVVAIGAVVLLYVLGLLRGDDVSKIEWPALLLFGGGLALGAAIDSSGFGAYLGNLLGSVLGGQETFGIYLSTIGFTVAMSLGASNTATAALSVPIMISLAASLGIGIKQLAILAGMGASLSFILPIGTPPLTMAYSSGYVTMKDMAKAGIAATLAGALLLAALAWLFW